MTDELAREDKRGRGSEGRQFISPESRGIGASVVSDGVGLKNGRSRPQMSHTTYEIKHK